MIHILRKYTDGDMQVIEYTIDGNNVSHTEKFPIEFDSKSILNIKNQKIKSLQQSYYDSFSSFQSSALGILKTYPIDKEAQDNLRDYQNRLIADPNKNSFYFKTIEDGTLVLHNRQQFLQLMEDAEMFKVNQTIKINDLINRVETAYNNGDSSGIEIITW